MPHCLIEASNAVLALIEPAELMQKVHDSIVATGICLPAEVKVRVQLYEHYRVAGEQADFVHVTASLLDGRTALQKKQVSMSVVGALLARLPTVQAISVDVRDMQREVFSNRRSWQEVGI
ncbi:5-carboxymethyl-2-hydroxymuconate isomerase [Pseudomonas cuatrocienegasensis]|uniref:5-carboxymethyl-2-hydroxymuconate isomerase n=1 Tax=Pseudomonas cuatrocienegasensis TaxID=543360 RepID=A0ABY1B7X6_9PSED|nr:MULTISPECIES: 5-carboxymethyl-2-hydroxymuconate Delta-isomerase [Pseudomonas]OEC33870.1 5-carboxymethyl-2-hydroxymuconate isomerase [Pseudomonas sp. 21C1]SEQ18712.1 5-carboxymethyl-2-hydroxymuconate isomerase [Pseudomonas cuatrocienegasensis]